MSAPDPVPAAPDLTLPAGVLPAPAKKGEVLCWDPPKLVARADFAAAVDTRGKEIGRNYTPYLPSVGRLTAFNRAAAARPFPFQKADRVLVTGGYESRYVFFESVQDSDKDLVRRKAWKLAVPEAGGAVRVDAVFPANPKDPADVARWDALAKAEAEAIDKELLLKQQEFQPGDVNKFCYNVLRTEGGCFPLKDRASFFFVPDPDRAVADFIERLMADVGGACTRLDVPETTGGARLAKQAVEAGMGMVLDELKKAVTQIGPTTRADTMTDQLGQVELAKLRIEALDSYLGKAKTDLLDRARALEADLKARLGDALKEA